MESYFPLGNTISLAGYHVTARDYTNRTNLQTSLFHRAFFNSIMDKTPTHALFTQHYISLAC